MQHKVSVLEAQNKSLAGDLDARRASEAAMSQEVTSLKNELCDSKAKYASATAESARLQLDLSQSRDLKVQLEADMKNNIAKIEAAQRQLTEAKQSQEVRALARLP